MMQRKKSMRCRFMNTRLMSGTQDGREADRRTPSPACPGPAACSRQRGGPAFLQRVHEDAHRQGDDARADDACGSRAGETYQTFITPPKESFIGMRKACQSTQPPKRIRITRGDDVGSPQLRFLHHGLDPPGMREPGPEAPVPGFVPWIVPWLAAAVAGLRAWGCRAWPGRPWPRRAPRGSRRTGSRACRRSCWPVSPVRPGQVEVSGPAPNFIDRLGLHGRGEGAAQRRLHRCRARPGGWRSRSAAPGAGTWPAPGRCRRPRGSSCRRG